MRIVLSSRGSRGDVYPILQVAVGLQRAGHDVQLCVPHVFSSKTRELGLPSLFYSDDMEEIMRGFGADWNALKRAFTWLNESLREQLAMLLDLCRDADALVTTVNEVVAPTIAEHFRIPHYRMALAPHIPGISRRRCSPFRHCQHASTAPCGLASTRRCSSSLEAA